MVFYPIEKKFVQLITFDSNKKIWKEQKTDKTQAKQISEDLQLSALLTTFCTSFS